MEWTIWLHKIIGYIFFSGVFFFFLVIQITFIVGNFSLYQKLKGTLRNVKVWEIRIDFVTRIFFPANFLYRGIFYSFHFVSVCYFGQRIYTARNDYTSPIWILKEKRKRRFLNEKLFSGNVKRLINWESTHTQMRTLKSSYADKCLDEYLLLFGCSFVVNFKCEFFPKSKKKSVIERVKRIVRVMWTNRIERKKQPLCNCNYRVYKLLYA